MGLQELIFEVSVTPAPLVEQNRKLGGYLKHTDLHDKVKARLCDSRLQASSGGWGMDTSYCMSVLR